MPARRSALIAAGLIGVMMVAGVWAWIEAPASARVAIHFNATGRPNGWGTPARAFFTLPVLATFVWVLLAILPHIDPRGANISRSEKAYGAIWVAIIGMLGVQQGSLIARAFGVELPMSRISVAALGILFVVLGNVLGKVRWNYTVGIRTPWTLADERVWDKTHRFGGWAFVGGGILLLIGAFAAPPAVPISSFTLPVILGIALATFIKSYLIWKEEGH